MRDKIYIDNPKVQILMATYNGADFLEQQLDSIFNQTYKNWELLISDDGSSDKTLEILREYEKKHSDKIKIVGYGEQNRGACANFFYLLSGASDEYIMFCDQDDYWKRDKIEVTLKKMTEAEGELTSDTPILVFTDLEIVDDKLNTISKSYLRYSNLNPSKVDIGSLIIQNTVTGCTAMINKSLGSLILKCEDTSNIIMHDWWMAITASCFGRCIFLQESTIKYRQHAANAIGVRHIYELRYLIGKIFRHNNMRSQLINSSKQAEKFLKVYYNLLTDRQKNLLSDYSNIYNKGKIKRLFIFCRHGICMHSLARKVGQFIYG